MSQTYVTFKKYPDAKQAQALQQFLIENGIECTFKDTSPSTGTAISGDFMREYEVQLHPDNFEQAETLLEKQAEGMIADLPEDYYLLTFTDEELHDVVMKHDEWSEFDYLLARKLLEERGKTIDEASLKQLRKQRLEDLAKPEKDQTFWVVMGYFLAISGGLFGIITGYVLLTSQKTLPNGQMVHTYSKRDRKHGKNILILGLILLVLIGAIKILKLV